MKIVLTGANGFLGSYIANAFGVDGHDVIALIRPGANTSNLSKDPKIILEHIDYKKSLVSQFQNIKEKHGEIDLFVHNAGVTVSLNPNEYLEINTQLTGTIVSAVEENNLVGANGKLVYVSSLTAQGPAGVNRPVSKYGESKLKAESFFTKSKINHLIIRPTAIYGAGDYAFLPLLKGAKSKLYPVTNKRQKMSMIHAEDLARIILEESKKSTGIFHATDGVTYLHDDFVKALSKVVGKKIIKIPVPSRLSISILGLSDLWHKLIGKRPSITREKYTEISMDWNLHEDKSLVFSDIPCKISLEEGFKDAYDFYKSKKLL